MLASWELFAEKHVRTLFVAVHSNYALFFLSFSLSLYIYIYIYFLFTLHVSVMNGPVHTTCTRGIHNIFMNFNNAHWHFFYNMLPHPNNNIVLCPCRTRELSRISSSLWHQLFWNFIEFSDMVENWTLSHQFAAVKSSSWCFVQWVSRI